MLQCPLEQKQELMSTETVLGACGGRCQSAGAFEEATHTVYQDDTAVSSVVPCIQALKAALRALIAHKDERDLPGLTAEPPGEALSTCL